MLGLLLTSDLMFSSRVSAVANQRGLNVQVLRTPNNLLEELSPDARLVMIDLARVPLQGLDQLVDRLRELGSPPHIVAYGPHVDEQTLATARAAGCDQVLTRGQFRDNPSVGRMDLVLRQDYAAKDLVAVCEHCS